MDPRIKCVLTSGVVKGQAVASGQFRRLLALLAGWV
jgi:hypothetical protein